jgi:hypothetical protein
MTRDVVTVHPYTPFDTVTQVLVDRQMGAVPVVEDGGRLVGIVSRHDVLTGLARPAVGTVSLGAQQEAAWTPDFPGDEPDMAYADWRDQLFVNQTAATARARTVGPNLAGWYR